MITENDVVVIKAPEFHTEMLELAYNPGNQFVRGMCDGVRDFFGIPKKEPQLYYKVAGRTTIKPAVIKCEKMSLYDDKIDLHIGYHMWRGVYPIVAHGAGLFTVSIDAIEDAGFNINEELDAFSRDMEMFH
jgi:hypothetical protein